MEYPSLKFLIKLAATGLALLAMGTFTLCFNWYLSTQQRTTTHESLVKIQLKHQLILNMSNIIHNRTISLSKLVSTTDTFLFDDEYLRFSNYADHFINSKNLLLEYHINDAKEARAWEDLFNASKISSQAAHATIEFILGSQHRPAMLHYLTEFIPAVSKLAKHFSKRLRAVTRQEKAMTNQLSDYEHNIDDLVAYIIAAFTSLGLSTFISLILAMKLYYKSAHALTTHISSLAELFSQRNISSEEQIKRLLQCGSFLLNMDTGALSKLSQDSSTALLLNYYSTTSNIDIGDSISTDRTFCSAVNTNKHDVITIDLHSNNINGKPLIHDSQKITSYIACKIYQGDNVFGILYFSSKSETHHFSPIMQNILGLISGWISYILDKKYSSEELRQTRLDAENANTLKNSFLSNISHELRTPLNAIIGYSDLLVDALIDSEDLTSMQDAKHISNSGSHLLSLINEILDLSYIEAGQFDLQSDYFYFNRVIDKIAASVSTEMDRNKNVFEFDKSTTDIMLYTDISRLTQVLVTILTIACQFNKNSKIHLSANTRHEAGKDWLEINITDYGSKMSDDQLQRIFKPFTQADSSYNSVYGGTGLELTISKRICQLMGGDITVKNNTESNTQFSVTIPSNVISQSNSQYVKAG